MLLLRADDEVFDWMRLQVAEPRDYMLRLAEIDAEPMLEATDRFALRSGRLIERRPRRSAAAACRSAGCSPSGNGRDTPLGHRVLLAAAGRGAS